MAKLGPWVAMMMLAGLGVGLIPGGAQAQTLNLPAPAEVVLTNAQPVTYTSNTGVQVSAVTFVNFTRISADPGNWNYDICHIYELVPAVCLANQTPTSIVNRPGWVSFRNDEALQVSGPAATGVLVGYNISANTTKTTGAPVAGSSGIKSSAIYVNTLVPGAQNQTGNMTLAAPLIRSVTVQGNITSPGGATVSIIWQQSTSDPNASTTGDFNYVLLQQNVVPSSEIFCNLKQIELATCIPGQGTSVSCNIFLVIIQLRTCQVESPGGLTYVAIPSLSGAGNAGLRYQNISAFGSAPFYMALDVTPVDNATGLVGTTSCQTVVDPSKPNQEAQACGIFLTTNLNINPAVGVQGPPVFPGLSVPAMAYATGLTSTNLGYALAGAMILGLGIVGYLIGRKPGAGFTGAFGAYLAFTFNLIPAYAIIVIVTVCAAVIVLSFAGGSKS
jgi:hypothetical protein